jgi:alkylresorcinol/alkylpyrone synthase
MPGPKIAAVATATPPWRYDQATVLRMSGYDDPRRMGFFSNSLIETRHLYMDPETFTPDESVDQLNDRWRRGAVEVGKAAVARAIEGAGWRREDVDFLATTTCTGRVCPSLDAQIINELGLKSTIQRVHVGDTGCASAMVAMQQVSNHLRAFPDHRAVMVAVEICADGAGAIAISRDGAGPEIVEHRTMFRSEHLGAMGFEYPGGRPRVVLSKDVRRIGAGMMKEMADALMADNGLKTEDIAHFVLHSAGRRVIEQVAKLMTLDETRLAHSRSVLQQYGNMSSATVVFVLDDLLRSREPVPGDWGLMIALGPGFAAEGALLRW